MQHLSPLQFYLPEAKKTPPWSRCPAARSHRPLPWDRCSATMGWRGLVALPHRIAVCHTDTGGRGPGFVFTPNCFFFFSSFCFGGLKSEKYIDLRN